MRLRVSMGIISAAVAVVLGMTTSAFAQWTDGPLDSKWADKLRATPSDPLPKELSNNAHFAVSDERRHDLFREEITGAGGAFIGVGPEQNYLMASFAKPEVLIPMDFDQFVVDLHFVHGMVFRAKETHEEYVQAWHKKNADALMELIRSEEKDPKRQAKLLKVAKKSRGLVYGKLRKTARLAKANGFDCYVNSAEHYKGVRALWQQNRVFPVRGDLTGSVTMQYLAKTLGEMGLPVRVLYLSNAERYFPWVDGYRENMRALGFDAKTKVIRTAGWGEKYAAEEDPLYMYLVSDSEIFLSWINGRAKNWKAMLYRRGPKIEQGYYRITRKPGEK